MLPGPRYTSYPTALQFSESIGEGDYLRAALASNGDPIARPLSIYVHVPFCANPCFYCGCTRVITRDRAAGARYLSPFSNFEMIQRKPAGQTGARIDLDQYVGHRKGQELHVHALSTTRSAGT